MPAVFAMYLYTVSAGGRGGRVELMQIVRAMDRVWL